MLTVERLTKTFHRGSPNQRIAIDEISLELGPGEFAVVIGGNGAGKSTLLNLVAGDIASDSGRIVVAGHDVTALPTHRRARWIGRVFQDPMVGTAGALTVEENLALAERRGRRRGLGPALTTARRERYRALLAPLGLGLDERLGTRADLLSGGQRQSLSLMMAIVEQPALLLLDEHCAALDPRTAEIVMSATVAAIAARGITTLMVTHNMQHAIEHGTRLIMLDAGRKRLDVGGDEKGALTVERLVQRFHVTDDKLLLAG